MKEIYFDNSSTSLPVLSHNDGLFGNPLATHALGVKAHQALESARKELCSILGCEQGELVFTSGGTESNNLALTGYALANKRNTVRFFALPWAHPSVTETASNLTGLGHEVRIEPLSQLSAGIAGLFSEGLNFISIPQVCHETGSKFDVERLSAVIKQANPKNTVHVDGAQGFCKEKLKLKNIDIYSFSGHKIHGPFVGGLVVRKGVRLLPMIVGGGQEAGLRAGTPNTKGAVALAKAAIHLHGKIEQNNIAVSEINGEMRNLAKELDNVYVNSAENSSPYILNISFVGIKGEVLANMLSGKGIFVSTGAACKVGKKDVPALELMGFGKERAQSAIRFSFSPFNSMDEARRARKTVAECVKTLRKIGGAG